VVRLRAFDYINYALLFLLTSAFILPFMYIVFLSISDSYLIANGNFVFWPTAKANLEAYKIVFENTIIWTGYANSILYAMTGTVLALVLCSLPAYVLTVHEFRHKRLFTVFFAITMFFNGGIIPTFLVIRNLGLLDSLWAIIIPPALSAWNIILFRTNFKSVPESLIESAKIDGAGHGWIYARLIVPLSKPVFAVLAIFSFVGHWNSYFPALLYLTTADKMPLMIILRKLVVVGNLRGTLENQIATMAKPIEFVGFQRSLKMAIIMCSVLPIIMVYPFMQRYLAKGIMIGALRG